MICIQNRPFKNFIAGIITPIPVLAVPVILFTAFGVMAQDEQDPNQRADVRETHGAWEVICVEDTDNCVMQQIGKSEKGDDALRIQISRLEAKAQDGTPIPATVEIMAPLGVVLPAGVRIRIDDGEPHGVARFGICLPVGCVAQGAVSDVFVGDMKTGGTAEAIVIWPPNRDIGVELSLDGFTKAFDSLKPLRPEDLAPQRTQSQ